MTEQWICPECKIESCIGHCPRCHSNQIGGGGCNGMFCTACGLNWGSAGDENDPDLVDGKDV